MTTSPDSVTYPPQAYGLLGPLPWGTINAGDYGVVGDDSFDNTLRLQEALDDAAALGAPVYIPPGVYRTGVLTWPTGLTTVYGAGMRLTTLKRIRASDNRNSIILISSETSFEIADLTLDGDKATQTLGSANLRITGCSDFTLRRVRNVGAYLEGSGYGEGMVIDDVPPTNPTGVAALVVDCEAYQNGGRGVSVTGTGSGISIDGGVYSYNGQAGIQFQPSSGVASVLVNPSVTNVRAEYNGGSGISFGGYIEADGNYGNADQPTNGAVIANCQVNNNSGYGIVFQVNGGVISGCTVKGNGFAGGSRAGVLVNAINVKVLNNTITGNTLWGLDLGGAENTQVVGNTISFNTNEGMNIGGCRQILVTNNVFEDNEAGGVVINRWDGGSGYGFPYASTGTTIDSNRFINTLSNTLFGVTTSNFPQDVTVTNNRFVWPDTTGNNCITLSIAAGRVHGNALERNGSQMMQFQLNASTSLVFPEWADELLVNTATTVTNILTRTYQSNTQRVSWIDLTDPGSGYTSDPDVSITGGGGSGATASAVRKQDGTLAFVRVTARGLSYTTTPTVSITGGGGSGATAVAHMNGTRFVRGRELMLSALGATLNITNGSNIRLPVAAGETFSLPSRSRIMFTATDEAWECTGYSVYDGPVPSATGFLSPGFEVDSIGRTTGSAFILTSGGPRIVQGTGAPSVLLALTKGSLYLRNDGGVGSTLYVTQGAGTWNAVPGV